jgi:alpha-methylacyl-CoA racemase
MTLPLAGVRVVDFSTRLPGPLATMLLAEAGAEVVKIERPGSGDEMRHIPPLRDGVSVYFTWLNHHKECRALDLKSPEGRDAALALTREADILVEQFRPGVMERLGLGAAALHALNPRLVYCSITGYGAGDPRSLTAAHDLNYQAAVGLLDIPARGHADRPPLPPVLLADIAGGAYPAFANILLALMRRNVTGRGAVLDIAMSRNLGLFQWWHYGRGMAGEGWAAPGAARHSGGSARYNLYRTRDGRFLAVAALEEHFWRNFLAAIDLPATAVDEADPASARRVVADRIAQEDAATWLARLAGQDVCVNLALTIEEGCRALASGADGIGPEPPIVPAFRRPSASGAPGLLIAASPRDTYNRSAGHSSAASNRQDECRNG